MRGTMTEKDKKRENKAETMAVRAALLVVELQRKRPLVHGSTHYVTANDSVAAGLDLCEKGVDVSEADQGRDRTEAALAAAERLGCTVAVTGSVDVVTDGSRVIRIHGGTPLMARVTGTGCMTSALSGAFAGAGKDPLTAVSAALAAMGIAGELAFEKAGHIGCGSFHMALLDAVGNLNEKIIRERAKIEER